jgi:hypothetical protein
MADKAGGLVYAVVFVSAAETVDRGFKLRQGVCKELGHFILFNGVVHNLISIVVALIEDKNIST